MIEKTPFDEKIETERLILKPYDRTFECAIMLYNAIKNNWDFLTRFLYKMLNTKSPEDEYAWLVSMSEKWKNMDGPCYSIWTKDGKFVGSCDLHSMDYERQTADVGYWLQQEYAGKGYMTEALKALEDNFFARGFNRLTIVMDTENTPSEKVAIRCGYTKEGVMRQWHYNPTLKSFRDMYLYSKLKSEWEKQR
ncbi:MAG: GNAT family N-acetyltransferase [Alphaproteobacteria bacterium]|nr:GNAT family N-acetyltransferase [Alphaproteobacteria bacterium]